MTHRCLALATLIAAGCARAVLNSAPLDQDFELGVGGERRIAESQVKIKFVRVVEDSRCPTDVVCVWQGNARVQVDVDSAGKRTSVSLNTGIEPRSMTAFGYMLELRDVRPARNSKTSVAPADYVAVVRLTRP